MTAVSTMVAGSPPWADFAFSGLPAGTAMCRMLRQDPDGRWVLLPGSNQRPILGAEWRFIDHGFPVSATSRTVQYRIEPLSAAGATIPAGVLTWSAVAAEVGHSEAWISDPLDPLSAVLVDVMEEGRDTGWGGTGGGLLPPIGGPPISTGFKRWRERDWAVSVTDPAGAARIVRMIEDGGVLLLRGDLECLVHPTGVVYMQVSDPSMSWLLPHSPRRRYTIGGAECAPPAILQVVASRTYADDLAEHPTHAASKAAFGTYLQRVRG